ncbi:RSP_7527 family protein [Pararhodobacter zhoushanensis]|uniref:Uncharacterized protein n=1 Tax=Pararhodobacter zhoushanensis TaxID=2479545 RepID=A0ABT3H103_9RHOB|nr:hypothetical protein [Pararhodobacter zhoushanensis]MCW1933451.1 hypothetical protein [Pararhodobacter zhoushanensis]
MTENTQNLYEIKEFDLLTLEREARAMQARAVADMFKSLRRGVVALFARGGQAHTA